MALPAPAAGSMGQAEVQAGHTPRGAQHPGVGPPGIPAVHLRQGEVPRQQDTDKQKL